MNPFTLAMLGLPVLCVGAMFFRKSRWQKLLLFLLAVLIFWFFLPKYA